MNIIILILIITSIYLIYYDIKFKRVPNLINLFLLITVIIGKILENESLINPIISGLIAFSTFLLINIITKGKLGVGDAKYSFIISFYFGYYFWLKSIFYCSILALLLSVYLLLSKKLKKNTPIPFIPFLVFGWVFELILNII